MKQIALGFLMFFIIILPQTGQSQCVSLACPGNVAASADTGLCTAVVNYSMPVGSNSCTAAATQTFNYTGAIQIFVVPAGTTSITVEAYGAQGGGGSNNGGRGAYIKGDIAVTPGDSLKVLVGQMGQVNYGYGGGGGSFIATIGNVPLIVAGGGGGAEHNDAVPGYDALVTTNGQDVENALGGTAGNGGELGNPNTSGCGWSGSGGGGFFGNGGASGDGGGFSFVNGGAGGTDPSGNCVVGGSGGFGGGGAAGNPGGGGGGYSGGAGGANIGIVPNRGGGGGGSYNSGTNQVNTAGVQTGNGMIVFNYNAAGPAYVSMLQGLGIGAAFPVGVNTEVYIVTDSLGDNDTCSFTITVMDTEAPTLSCPSTMTVNADSGMCSAIVTFSAPPAFDNCSVASTVQTAGLASGSAFPVGTTTVVYLATDSAGNSTNCSFNITVVDADGPVLTCPGDLSTCDTIVTGIAPNALDACSGIASIDYTLSGATTGNGSNDAGGMDFNIGATTVTYTATDSVGNSSNCSFVVTVNALPVLSVGASAGVVCLNDGPVSLTGTPAGGSWSGSGVTGNSFTPATAGSGTHTLTYQFTDINGCSNSEDLVITVNTCTGIRQNADFENIQVFPNPAQELLNIRCTNTSLQAIQLYNATGQLVYRANALNGVLHTISLHDLTQGLYFLQVTTDKGLHTHRVMIAR